MLLLWLIDELCPRCFILAKVPVAAAATAAADITAEAAGGKVADVVEADEEGFTMPSSSRIDRLELALVAAEPSVCCGCC